MALVLAAMAGLLTGAGLIVGIGPQNAMVLRAGFVRTHVALVVAVCATADVVLITTGVAGVGSALAGHRWLVVTATIAGATYVIAFGVLSARRALVPAGVVDARAATPGIAVSRIAAVGAALIPTLLNPHVYLDTVLTLGTIAHAHGPVGKWAFGGGACLASVIWFAALGFGAARFAPVFARPRAWQVLDAAVAVVMVGCGVMLLASLAG